MKYKNLIGRERPYDYPEPIHYSNKERYVDTLNDYNFYQTTDFQKGHRVYDDSTDFGSLQFIKQNNKSVMIALIFVLGLYLYNKKKI